MGYKSSFQLVLSSSNGKSLDFDLTEAGNVYGGLDKCRTESGNCDIKTAEMSNEGFEGVYGVPRTIQKALRRRRMLGHEVHQELLDHIEDRRRLQADNPNAKIFNPIYCIKEEDSFIFSIESPIHFPVYMKNSVLNTNPTFDYGAFTVLEEEMLRRSALGDNTPSIFAFTFVKAGSYIFNDSANTQKIMVVQVVGGGESCTDSDRFVQTITEDTMGEAGVAQRGDLILEPNYALIGAMGGLLIFATIIIMISVGYCLHKGWKVKEIGMRTYRDYQLPMNIHHEDKDLFERNNDFINFKSDLIDSEEDDLDYFNLDI
jgi:hypothetical protein